MTTRRRSVTMRIRRAAELPELERTPAGFVWKGRDYPAARISLRSGDGEAFTVVDGMTGSLLGLVERERAYSTVHEGAVYLHLGEQYLVEQLDHDGRVAVVVPASVDWYTQVKKETETTIEEAERVERRLGLELSFGRVSVSEQVVGYARKAVRDGSTIDVVPMLMPETTFETEAIWFSPEPAQLEGLEQMPALLGTLHAAEHTLIALLPLWAMCDRWDIGGLSTNVHYQTGRPTIFVYDGHTGGMGLTARGFASFEGWVEDTTRLLQRCPCTSGCPSCVQSPKCGNLNEPLDKAGARTLLERMLSGEKPRSGCSLTQCTGVGSGSSQTRVETLSISARADRHRDGIRGKEVAMQVMALIYGDASRWDAFSDDEREAVYAQYRAFSDEAGKAGVVAGGAELASTRDATTVAFGTARRW